MSTEVPQHALRRRSVATFIAAVAIVGLCWILGNPRSSGPDEPSHMVTSAGLVRGDTEGDPNPANPATRLMDVPAMVGAPDPGCWAFEPTETPACTNDVVLSDQDAELATTSYNYPPWALLLPGVASYVPWPAGYAYLARGLSSILPVVLVGSALTMLVRRRRLLGASALLGLTPIVWFTFGTVNPSSLAIAGGFALCTGCLLLLEATPRADLMAAAGWVAVVLPRRDGPLWAALVVILVCLTHGCRPSMLWRRLPHWARRLVILVAVVPPVHVLVRGDSGFNLALSFATLGVIVFDAFQIGWDRWPAVGQRAALVAGASAVAAIGTVIVLVQRPGGFDADVVRLVIGNTGDHLVQLVGVLGWLNAPVPTSGVLLFWATIGGLSAAALIERPRSAAALGIGLGSAVVVAWLLELGQGANYGDYWQGRYSMPLAVALPIVAAWRPRHADSDRLALAVLVAAWAVSNLGYFAAQRRWAVGNDGTWYVWRWDTWEAPLPPVVLLLCHAVATAWLGYLVATSAAETGASEAMP